MASSTYPKGKLLRQFLMEILQEHRVPGVEWLDEKNRTFKIPWVKVDSQYWSPDKVELFRLWEINKSRYIDGNKDYSKWKTNFRNAVHKSKDIKEVEIGDNCKILKFKKLLKSTEIKTGSQNSFPSFDTSSESSGSYQGPPPKIPKLNQVKVQDEPGTSAQIKDNHLSENDHLPTFVQRENIQQTQQNNFEPLSPLDLLMGPALPPQHIENNVSVSSSDPQMPNTLDIQTNQYLNNNPVLHCNNIEHCAEVNMSQHLVPSAIQKPTVDQLLPTGQNPTEAGAQTFGLPFLNTSSPSNIYDSAQLTYNSAQPIYNTLQTTYNSALLMSDQMVPADCYNSSSSSSQSSVLQPMSPGGSGSNWVDNFTPEDLDSLLKMVNDNTLPLVENSTTTTAFGVDTNVVNPITPGSASNLRRTTYKQLPKLFEPSTHQCDASSDKAFMYVELVYLNNVINNQHVNPHNICRVYHNKLCLIQKNDLTMPQWDKSIGNDKAFEKACKILDNCSDGIKLKCDQEGNIFIQRMCNIKIFTSNKNAPEISKGSTQIYDFSKDFELAFQKQKETGGLKPYPHVMIYFGLDGNKVPYERHLISVRVTNCAALNQLLIKEEERRNQNEEGLPSVSLQYSMSRLTMNE